MSDPNLKRPVFDASKEHPGFTRERARLGAQAGAVKTGLSLFEVPPGQAAYPYHWHFSQEELIVVLEGAPSLRTPEGWRELDEGAVVCFPTGEAGAHQLANRTDGTVRFLAFAAQQPDGVIYPDSEKVCVAECLPEGDGGFRGYFRIADEVDYFEGEEAPKP